MFSDRALSSALLTENRGVVSPSLSCPFIIVSSLGPLLPGVEVCAQGGTELRRVETAELSQPEALAVPGAEHPAPDGRSPAGDPESGLA